MKFKYNGRIYNPVNLEKKLKKMGITLNDIEIIPDKKEEVEYDNVLLYKWRNKKDGSTIHSIYDNLDKVKHIINIDDYEPII